VRWKSARLAENGGGCNVGEGCGTICEHSLTREQAWQHAAFLRHLRRTGNVRVRAAGGGRLRGDPASAQGLSGLSAALERGRCDGAGSGGRAANVGKTGFVIIPYNKSNLVWLI
jgi:hypothetical protein